MTVLVIRDAQLRALGRAALVERLVAALRDDAARAGVPTSALREQAERALEGSTAPADEVEAALRAALAAAGGR